MQKMADIYTAATRVLVCVGRQDGDRQDLRSCVRPESEVERNDPRSWLLSKAKDLVLLLRNVMEQLEIEMQTGIAPYTTSVYKLTIIVSYFTWSYNQEFQ